MCYLHWVSVERRLGPTCTKPSSDTLEVPLITTYHNLHSNTVTLQVQLNVRYIAVTLLHQNLTNVSVNGDMSQPMVTLSSKYFTEVKLWRFLY